MLNFKNWRPQKDQFVRLAKILHKSASENNETQQEIYNVIFLNQFYIIVNKGTFKKSFILQLSGFHLFLWR